MSSYTHLFLVFSRMNFLALCVLLVSLMCIQCLCLCNLGLNLQSLPYKLVIGCIPLYAVFRIMQKVFQELPGLIQNSVVRGGLPFACASSSLNKPTPLKLDVSVPSLHDIKWSFARFLYLFNIQLEKNIATYVLSPIDYSFIRVLVAFLLLL